MVFNAHNRVGKGAAKPAEMELGTGANGGQAWRRGKEESSGEKTRAEPSDLDPTVRSARGDGKRAGGVMAVRFKSDGRERRAV